MPVLPTDLPAGLDRAVTALALGLAAAGAAVIVWSGGLAVRPAPAAEDARPDAPSRAEAGGAADPAATDGRVSPRTRTMPPPPEEGEILGDGGISRPTCTTRRPTGLFRPVRSVRPTSAPRKMAKAPASRPSTPMTMPTVASVLAESTSSWLAVLATVMPPAASPSAAASSSARGAAPCSSSPSTSVSSGAGCSGSSPPSTGSSIQRTTSPLA